ncbi:MAG TPA: hypothetical protein VJN92_13745 [Candidatus Acidoferrum sp.]|nr:hypothetical protein [Candidatus Acidoferrum sp.]
MASWWRRSLLAVLSSIFLLSLFSSPCRATGPEGAWGKYSYKSKDLDLEFSWDIDGIKDVRTNGHSYAKTVSAESENSDNFGDEGVFSFWIKFEDSNQELKRLDLLLFFSNGKLKCVSGLYSDVSFSNAQKSQSKVILAKAIELRYSRAD